MQIAEHSRSCHLAGFTKEAMEDAEADEGDVKDLGRILNSEEDLPAPHEDLGERSHQEYKNGVMPQDELAPTHNEISYLPMDST